MNLKEFISKNKIYLIISIVCIILIIVSLYFIVNNLKESSEPTISEIISQENIQTEPVRTPKKHNYNLNNIKSESGWKHYYEKGKLASYYGIDLSYYQKEIDWELLKSEGISFVMLRIGYRGYESADLFIDKHFYEYLEGAEKAGIDVGIYFFSQALSVKEAIEEAEFVVENLKGYEITYPVAFDWEPVEKESARTSLEGFPEMTESCIAFCEIIKAAGYTPMLYANKSQLLEQYDILQLEQYDIWLAEYDNERPEYPYQFAMWQYTSEGEVEGIEGDVDLNICFKDYTCEPIETSVSEKISESTS